MTYCDIMMLNLIKVKFLGGEAREFGGEASPLSPMHGIWQTINSTPIATEPGRLHHSSS